MISIDLVGDNQWNTAQRIESSGGTAFTDLTNLL